MDIIAELCVTWYYLVCQFELIFPYWLGGVITGSLISVFASGEINTMIAKLGIKEHGLIAIIPAALLGAASPLCMYGTIPLIASLGKKDVPQHLLAAFMISSILINPNLFVFSFTLGSGIALTRLFLSVVAGISAGISVRFLFSKTKLFTYDGFTEKKKCASGKKTAVIFLSDMHRAIIKTAPYFLAGILLTALFDRYFPKDVILNLFGKNRGFGVLMAASMGVPVYVCGGGTIPLLKSWLQAGMGPGSAMAFMLTGPATKITNLSAVKIILGTRNFVVYIAFNIVFAIIAGFLTDIIYTLF